MCSPPPRCHSFSESENRHPFTRKRSVGTYMTPRRNSPSEDLIKKEHMTSFQRSLKLLGLQPKELGINNEVSTSNYHKSSLRVEPTFCTRLTNRSFSLENLKFAIEDHICDGQKTFEEHLDRKMLSSAVYEAWYFQKLDEARRRKKAEVLNDQRKKEDFKKVKTEKKRKAEENFNEWKELKDKQRQQRKQKQQEKEKLGNKVGDNRSTGGTRVKPNQEEAFLLWKREKDKLLRQKKLEQRIQKETMKSNNEKKTAVEIAYKLWKKRADEAMKEKVQEEERRKQEEEESKKEKERLKRESAESSFRAWKLKKDSELRKIFKESKLAEEEKKNMQLMQEAERMYAAEQVFEEWLDQMDKRHNKEIHEVHMQKQRSQHQLAWRPGGCIHRYTT